METELDAYSCFEQMKLQHDRTKYKKLAMTRSNYHFNCKFSLQIFM